MTKSEILNRLVDIAKTGKYQPLICCDMVHQEDLYDAQEKLTILMVDLANDCGGPQGRMLEQQFPYVFGVSRLPEAK